MTNEYILEDNSLVGCPPQTYYGLAISASVGFILGALAFALAKKAYNRFTNRGVFITSYDMPNYLRGVQWDRPLEDLAGLGRGQAPDEIDEIAEDNLNGGFNASRDTVATQPLQTYV